MEIKEFKTMNTYNNSLYVFKTSKFSLHLEVNNVNLDVINKLLVR